MDWGTIFLQLATQTGWIGGFVGVIVFLQKRGVDVGALFRSFLGIRAASTAGENDANLRKDFQKLLTAMEVLTKHFNHETTSELGDLREGIDKMHEKQDKVVQILSEIKEYGIKCRKE